MQRRVHPKFEEASNRLEDAVTKWNESGRPMNGPDHDYFHAALENSEEMNDLYSQVIRIYENALDQRVQVLKPLFWMASFFDDSFEN